MKVIQEFKITDETFDQFSNNYKKIIAELKKEYKYRSFLNPETSSLYVEGEHDKVKEQVYQILSKYNVKAQSGIAMFEVTSK